MMFAYSPAKEADPYDFDDSNFKDMGPWNQSFIFNRLEDNIIRSKTGVVNIVDVFTKIFNSNKEETLFDCRRIY